MRLWKKKPNNIKLNEKNIEALKDITSSLAEYSEPLRMIKKYGKQFKKIFDKNKDGKIQIKELMNPEFFKWILVVLLTIAISVITSVITQWIFDGILNLGIMGIVLQFIIAPFVMGVMIKSTMDDYDGRLKKKDKEILKLKEDLATEKNGRTNDENKHEIEKTQLQGSMELKKQEIEWLRTYGTVPIKKPN